MEGTSSSASILLWGNPRAAQKSCWQHLPDWAEGPAARITSAEARLVLRAEDASPDTQMVRDTWRKAAALLAVGTNNLPSPRLVPCLALGCAAGGGSPR